VARGDGVRRIGLGLLVVLSGCDIAHARRENILPTELSLLVEDNAGRPLSLVMNLKRNTRSQLDVRVSEGMRLFDGRHLWELRTHQAGQGWTVELDDILEPSQPRDLPLMSTSAPEIVTIDRMEVWLRTSGGLVHCALQRPMCEAATTSAHTQLAEEGPRAGFRLWLTPEGDLRLSLPLDPDQDGQTILNNVHRVIGTHWVHEGFLERDAVLDRTFRGRASLVAMPRDVLVDGDLREWTEAEPLVVDAPWQIQSGADAWAGPKDASFSVTASRTPERVCFAGRVRDDDVMAGDSLAIRFGATELEVPLGAAGPLDGGFIGRDWFGSHFEVCSPDGARGTGQLPFVAALTDVDGSDGATVMSSAPIDEPDASGTIRVGP
jgi:hypothetical protein